jgi:hypothetical protein
LTDERTPNTDVEEPAEVVSGLPVLVEHDDDADAAGSELEAVRPGAAAVLVGPRQVAALAATGFAAGAATVALVQHRRARAVSRRLARAKPKRTAFGEVLTSNSFLVDVHLIRRD